VADRLRSMLLDANHDADVVQSVLAVVALKPAEALARATAVSMFRSRPEADALAAANKRIANILRKAAAEPIDQQAGQADSPEGKALLNALEGIRGQLDDALVAGDFNAALLALASLREPVDALFDKVLVMDPDPAVRARRLGLLARLRAAFLEVAD